MVKLREADWLALLAAVLCIMLGVASYNALNPDGVSYLDLAARLRDGDWARFVQGYWSPLYPAIIGLGSAITGREGPALIVVVHVINTLIALLGVAVTWWAVRRSGNVIFGRAAFAALLVCSAEAPRLEAVTPDLLLVAFVALIGCELLLFGGRRWARLGAWMGLAYLTKTSMWPWLVAAILLRLVLTSRSRDARLLVLKSAVVCLSVMLLWLVPLSLRTGVPTLGSAARLNACWYMRECDSRSPDTHAGEHRAYQPVNLGAAQVTVAMIGGTPWTYLPWSDPTTWAEGVITMRRVTPSVGEHLIYAAKHLGLVFGFWMPHIWIGLLLPVAWIMRRKGIWRELKSERRDAGLVSALGVLGILQFAAVHAEPRLVAPFVLLFALGVLAWLCAIPVGADESAIRAVGNRKVVVALSCLGLVVAVPRAGIRAWNQSNIARRTADRLEMITQAEAARVPPRRGPRRIAVIGPVFPLLTEAYRLGGTIQFQVFRPAVSAVLGWPPAGQQALAGWLTAQGATEVWVSKGGGAFSIIPLVNR